MRAVWSFWSAPFNAHRARSWASERHHLLSWVLSLETARVHFRESALYTDDEGGELLVEGIGLHFDKVSTELNALRESDPDWWMLGKLYTYRAQQQPFVHIDSDVFLWKSLPAELMGAPVLAQNPELVSVNGPYRVEVYDAAVRSAGGWLPKEWSWYRSIRGSSAASCGIVGGNHMDFLSYYADQAIRFIEHPANQPVWARLPRGADNILFEQYFLSACVQYYRHHPAAGFDGVSIRYLFESMGAAFNSENARRRGYTHLLAGAKGNQRLAERLETRVKRDFPESYERVLRYLGD